MPLPEHLQPHHENYAGRIDPAFLFFDKITIRKVEAERDFAARAALSDSEKHRLVEASKSPTSKGRGILAQLRWELSKPKTEPRRELFVGPPCAAVDGARKSVAAQQLRLLDESRERFCDVIGSQTIIQYREWSDEWRIRTQVDVPRNQLPPSAAGLRISKMLSQGGARKIADSCEYMAKTRGGFKTFVTGTFNDEARARIASGETSIQREATRALDALNKMYQRGWNMKSGERVEGHAGTLAYCWVVEVPKNEQGEDNPHLHMLFDWVVEYAHFQEWAARIESIWGNGYFHLEKIDDPMCAGAYMAKAAGYLTKAAGQSDQGEVTGNRYAISSNARAPSWSTIGTYQLGIMGMLIREVYDSISAKHSAKFLERHRLREEREKIRAAAKKAQGEHVTKRYPLWAKNALTEVGEKLKAVREKINAMKVRASKYQLVCKGRDSFERFLVWAEAHGWNWKERPPSHFYHFVRSQIQAVKHRRGALTCAQLSAWMDYKIENLNGALDLEKWGEYQCMTSVGTFKDGKFGHC